VLTGLQGAGKSSFYRERYAATHALVSRDRFRNHPNPSRRQRDLLAAALREGRSVVVDNTNATLAERAAILEVAREFAARAVSFYFGRDIRSAIARNARREGKERIPVVGLLATARRLVPPTLAEGFDELHLVELSSDGGFITRRLHARGQDREGRSRRT